MLPELYVAGMFDAVGAIGIARTTDYAQRTTFVLTVEMAHKDREALQCLADRFGGGVTDSTHRGRYVWRVSSRKAATFLEYVQPHTRSRGKEIAIGLDFTTAMRPYSAGVAVAPELMAMREQYRQMLRAAQKGCDAVR